MCGIAGIVSTETKGVAGSLERLSLSLEHRGPDGNGWAILSSDGDAVMGSTPASIPETSIGLVHRRLAIIDTTDAAHQPMSIHQRGPLLPMVRSIITLNCDKNIWKEESGSHREIPRVCSGCCWIKGPNV